jgi:membrane associated rhomboid family serine protease
VFSVPPLTPFVKKLLIVLFSAVILELILQNFVGIDVIGLLALDPVQLSPLTPLQLFSYVLIERMSSALQWLIGLFFMWLILSPFEQAFGARHTFQLALAGTLAGSLGVVIAAQLAPIPGYVLAGSYTIAYAGIAAMTQVMRGARMSFFGVLPMTSQQLLTLLFVIAGVQYLLSRDHLGLVATLASILAGGGYVRYMARPRRRSPPKRPGAGTRFRVLRGGGGGGGGSSDSDRPKWLN